MIYSPGRNTTIIYPYDVTKCNDMCLKFSVCWLQNLLCHVLDEKGAPFAHVHSTAAGGLYCRPVPQQAGPDPGWLGLPPPPHISPEPVPRISGSEQLPDALSGNTNIWCFICWMIIVLDAFRLFIIT
jgi:hypothetical protein